MTPPGTVPSDIAEAAHYVAATLPTDTDGPVRVSVRYRPSQTVGGDCFDYRWFDDDHLIIYLLDVSGHGLPSALMSVSVHNMLRTDAKGVPKPEQVLAELNRRYQMNRHDGRYLTIWYGVYQNSTRELTYAAAGHPPALVFFSGDQVARLESQSPPVGMFTDTGFSCDRYRVKPGSRILVYSDGAFDLPLPGGGLFTLTDFADRCAELFADPDEATSPSVLDTLLRSLEQTSASGDLKDDCSLLLMTTD